MFFPVAFVQFVFTCEEITTKINCYSTLLQYWDLQSVNDNFHSSPAALRLCLLAKGFVIICGGVKGITLEQLSFLHYLVSVVLEKIWL